MLQLTGWACPACERVWAPHVSACGPCNQIAQTRNQFRFVIDRPVPQTHSPCSPAVPDTQPWLPYASGVIPQAVNWPTITTSSLDEGFNV